MLEHAFRFVGRVVFLIGPQNCRSQRAVLKIGAIRAGSRVDGSGAASHVFQLTPAGRAQAVRGWAPGRTCAAYSLPDYRVKCDGLGHRFAPATYGRPRQVRLHQRLRPQPMRGR